MRPSEAQTFGYREADPVSGAGIQPSREENPIMGALRKGVTVLDEVLSEPRNQMMFGMIPGVTLYTGGRIKNLLSMAQHGPDPKKFGSSFPNYGHKGQSGVGTYFTRSPDEALMWGHLAHPSIPEEIGVAAMKFPEKKISKAPLPPGGSNDPFTHRAQHVLDQVGKGFPATEFASEVVIPNPNSIRNLQYIGVPEVKDPVIRGIIDSVKAAAERQGRENKVRYPVAAHKVP